MFSDRTPDAIPGKKKWTVYSESLLYSLRFECCSVVQNSSVHFGINVWECQESIEGRKKKKELLRKDRIYSVVCIGNVMVVWFHPSGQADKWTHWLCIREERFRESGHRSDRSIEMQGKRGFDLILRIRKERKIIKVSKDEREKKDDKGKNSRGENERSAIRGF